MNSISSFIGGGLGIKAMHDIEIFWLYTGRTDNPPLAKGCGLDEKRIWGIFTRRWR
jgi:hypothetical protein